MRKVVCKIELRCIMPKYYSFLLAVEDPGCVNGPGSWDQRPQAPSHVVAYLEMNLI